MAALDALKPLSDGPPPSWRERLACRIDQWMTSPELNRWASRSVLTRWLVRRRSAQLFDLMAGFVHSQVLLACVRLKLFEHVLQAPRTADELATLCRVRPWPCTCWSRAARADTAWAPWVRRWWRTPASAT